MYRQKNRYNVLQTTMANKYCSSLCTVTMHTNLLVLKWHRIPRAVRRRQPKCARYDVVPTQQHKIIRIKSIM